MEKRDLFVDEYLQNNKSNSVIEALQEWNRREAERITLMQTLPFDLRRKIVKEIPGGRFTMLTSRQKENESQAKHLIDKNDLCYEPISVKEFKNYVLEEAGKIDKNGIKGIKKFNFISGYGLTIVEYCVRRNCLKDYLSLKMHHIIHY